MDEGFSPNSRRAQARQAFEAWPVRAKLVAAVAAALAVVAIGLLIAFLSWRSNAETWRNHAAQLERQVDTSQEELADVADERDALVDERDELVSRLSEIEEREAAVAEKEDALAERAEELDAIEASEERREEAEEQAAVGSTVNFNDWSMTLVDVQVHDSIDRETARGRYVVLLLDVVNNGSTDRDFLGFGRDFHLLDDQDREHSFDSSASLDYHHAFEEADTWHLEDIGPGLGGRLAVAFDVPEDAQWGLAAMVTRSDVSDPFLVEWQ